MSGFIDFNTTCPWQLYLFSFIHMCGGLLMLPIDVCELFSGVSCIDSEIVMQRMMALSMVYVGGIFGVLTHHNKDMPAKITRLSMFALNAATALLVSVVFIGNAKYGGFERSWMHVGDMWTMLVLVFVLASRVSQQDAEWSQMIPLSDGLGANCKTIILLFAVLALLKFLAIADFIDPSELMADGLEISEFASWAWRFTAVLILEMVFVLCFALLYEEESGQELVVKTFMVLTLIAAAAISSVQQYFSDWMGLNSNALWIQVGILLVVCLVVIVGGRSTGQSREGYSSV